MLRPAPESTEAATALYVCAFNLSIALGSFLGGFSTDTLSVGATVWVGVGLFALAAAVLVAARPELVRKGTS